MSGTMRIADERTQRMQTATPRPCAQCMKPIVGAALSFGLEAFCNAACRGAWIGSRRKLQIANLDAAARTRQLNHINTTIDCLVAVPVATSQQQLQQLIAQAMTLLVELRAELEAA